MKNHISRNLFCLFILCFWISTQLLAKEYTYSIDNSQPLVVQNFQAPKDTVDPFYKWSNPGIDLSATDMTVIPELNNLKRLRGFFLASELKELLESEDCVGVRVYNTKQEKMVAVGVKKNGFQITNPTLICRSTAVARTDWKAERFSTRGNVLFQIQQGDKEEHGQFASYFSKQMINNLLAENNADGIAFYELDLGELPSNSFKQKIDRRRIRRASTHLAVSINLENGKIPEIITNGSIANNLLSDRPCPGHCVWITRRRVVRTRSSPISDGMVLQRMPSTETDPPYYTAWNPNNQ